MHEACGKCTLGDRTRDRSALIWECRIVDGLRVMTAIQVKKREGHTVSIAEHAEELLEITCSPSVRLPNDIVVSLGNICESNLACTKSPNDVMEEPFPPIHGRTREPPQKICPGVSNAMFGSRVFTM